MSNAEYSIARNTEAAKKLLANIRASGDEDDAELIADTIEGETDLLEAIGAAVSEIDENDMLIAGGEAKIDQIQGRVSATKKRNDRIRAAIEQAMIATEQTTLRLPTATITLSKRAPGLIITNEADIPADYWVEQPRPAPKLDKKALLSDLKENKTVAGATLDNGSYSLTLRRK